MNDTLTNVNKLLVEIFNSILKIEENAIKNGIFDDVSITEIHTIEAIGLYRNRTMSETARKLNITVGTLTVAVNNLVKKGYVLKVKGTYDKRIVNIYLTKKGRMIFRKHRKFHSDLIKEAIIGLSEQEIEVFNHAVKNINNFFNDKYKLLKQGEAYV